LGAGFSAGAGIPLTVELLQLAMKKFSDECPGLFQRVDNYARECTQYYGEDELDYSKVDFSHLCTFLEYIELKEYGGGERWSDEGSKEKLALRFYLAKTIVEYTPHINDIPQIYIDFANQIQERDVIISFNWDCLLELALTKVGKTYSYNWENNQSVNIRKMHGSVNWCLNEPSHFGQSINTLDWKSLQFTKGMMDVELYHTSDLLDYNIWDTYSPLGEVSPFLVLPGYGKAFDVRSNATLWYKPEFAFASTHDVYIIGLSLAPDDFFIRSLFLSTLPDIACFTGVEGRKIFIINPDVNAKSNYDFVLTKGHAELITENFSINHIEIMKERVISISNVYETQ